MSTEFTPADETQLTFFSDSTETLETLFLLPDHFSKHPPSFFGFFFSYLLLFFWLSLSLLSISLFRFPTHGSTGRHMISPPLIGIRFTGLDQRGVWLGPSAAHIC